MIIYGNGSHSKIIMESLQHQGEKVICFIDDNCFEQEFNTIPIMNKYNSTDFLEEEIIIGIGNNQIRKKIVPIIRHKFGTLLDKTAYVSKFSKIGEGTAVLQNAIIQYNCKIGKHCIINVGAIVDHDAIIGDFVTVSPNVTICNNCEIGAGTTIEAGAIIQKNVKIGKNSHIASGTILIESVPEGYDNVLRKIN